MKLQPHGESQIPFKRRKKFPAANKNSLNSAFAPTAKDSSPKETIAYICGLRARIECEPLSEHSTHSDRVTNIGYCLFRGASVCLRNPELFLLPTGNSLISAFLQLMSVNQVHDQDNKNNCD